MSTPQAVLVFLAAAAVIAMVGTRLTTLADRLADRTGLGEAFVGAVFLGAVTSLPGITASVVAAWDGRAQMALSNAIGGIAAQTAFLAIADLAYRKANLEHAAASLPNMMQATVLVILLCLVIVAMVTPEVAVWAVHPVTPLLIVVYGFGIRMVRQSRQWPMWRPRRTPETKSDQADEQEAPAGHNVGMWVQFTLAAAAVVVAGYFVTQSIATLADRTTWMNESVAGGIFIAITTSLPELVTSVAAVRRGALTLAVSGIIGGNCFDTLFAAVADVAYREGSLLHAALTADGGSFRELILVTVSILMTTVLLLGMLRRQKEGPGRIGFESVTVLVIYAAAIALVSVT